MQAEKNRKNTRVGPFRPPAVAQDAPVAVTEAGVPIYAEPKTNKRGQVVIPKGALEGQITDETGRPVNRKGKPTGYLQQDPNVRTLLRRPNDVSLGPKETHDAFAVDVLQRRYGDHLKAMLYDPDVGDMRFPAGYLEGMTARERQDVEAGVRALTQLNRGVSI
jgi:hypothetical protein